MPEHNYVRPDNLFLKTINKAEYVSLALTNDGELCGALTKVHRIMPRGMGEVCYTAYLDNSELINAIKHNKTNVRVIDNTMCRTGKWYNWVALKSMGVPSYIKDWFSSVSCRIPHCDIAMLRYNLPVLCVDSIATPSSESLTFDYDKRPYTPETCIVLYGSLVFRDTPEMSARVAGIEAWSKSKNLIRFGEGYKIKPPFSYNSMNAIVHEDIYINLSEVMFSRDVKIVKENPFLIYVDWSRLMTKERAQSYAKQGYEKYSNRLIGKPKQSFEEAMQIAGEGFLAQNDLLKRVKPMVNEYNQKVVRGV